MVAGPFSDHQAPAIRIASHAKETVLMRWACGLPGPAGRQTSRVRLRRARASGARNIAGGILRWRRRWPDEPRNRQDPFDAVPEPGDRLAMVP